MSDLARLQDEIQYTFRDERLLRTALTHPSVAYELDQTDETNQRLEFLGDAVLQLVLSRALYARHPDAAEGDLTKARARLVNRRSLAEQGRQMALGRYLTLGRGEELQGGRERLSTLADAFEALLGALFIDGGYAVAEEFVLRRLAPTLDMLSGPLHADNPKGELQEMLQTGAETPPQYRIERTSGPDHNIEFECAVYHRGVELGRGLGKSKKEAESQAASAALRFLGQQPDSAASVSD
ncbi:MAG TPA: ribonuclease III [Verrucomicrobiota bacterium]|nr:ribonuclease III [Verrucomicrobiota bacterium]HRZ36770.1 ribonuclease III [Candidatus Paceibacterota bacterium]HRZ55014.1 ribonuclease III [Candidatus Paceibacterota bacterium]